MKVIALAAILALAAPAAAFADDAPPHKQGSQAAGGNGVHSKARTPSTADRPERRDNARDGGKIVYF